MQLVGATKGFILKPYLGKAFTQGLIGALIAITLITASVFLITTAFPVTKSVFNPFHLTVIYGMILVAGGVITTTSSFIIMQRYLGRSAYELY